MFKDSFEAGANLAEKLVKYAGKAIVLAIPRGGLQIGFEVAKRLKAPLDIIVTKKIGFLDSLNMQLALLVLMAMSSSLEERLRLMIMSKQKAKD